MTHEYIWDSDEPIDRQKAGLGALRERETRAMIEERLAVDHNMGGVLADGATQDGTHKQVTLRAYASDIAAITAAGRFFSKTVSGVAELCYINNSGEVVQFTVGGKLPFDIDPVGLVYLNSAEIVCGATYKTLLFDTEDESEGGSIVDGVFTPTGSGFYSIYLMFETQKFEGQFRLRKTVNAVVSTIYSWLPASSPSEFFHIVWLNAGESIHVEAARCTIEANSSIEIIKI